LLAGIVAWHGSESASEVSRRSMALSIVSAHGHRLCVRGSLGSHSSMLAISASNAARSCASAR
jgi:hypothetical protein